MTDHQNIGNTNIGVDELLAWEDGTLTDTETIDLFQRLVDSGLAWTLQGVYGRTAMRLIDAGYVVTS